MLVQKHGAPFGRVGRLVETEDFSAKRVQCAVFDKFIDAASMRKGRIELQKRFWPEQSCLELFFNFPVDAIICYLYKTACISGIIFTDNLVAKSKNVQCLSSIYRQGQSVFEYFSAISCPYKSVLHCLSHSAMFTYMYLFGIDCLERPMGH